MNHRHRGGAMAPPVKPPKTCSIGAKLFWVLAGFCYLVSPVDIIPGDLLFFPFGIIDDVGVVAFVLSRLRAPTPAQCAQQHQGATCIERVSYQEYDSAPARHVRRASNGRTYRIIEEVNAPSRFVSDQ